MKKLEDLISIKDALKLIPLESKDKEFVKVEGAGHNNLFVIGGEEYKNKLMKFISRHFERNIN